MLSEVVIVVLFGILSSVYGDDCHDNAKYVSKCPTWKSKSLCGENSSYRPFMEKNCPKTCGFCTTKKECVDHSSYAKNCAHYKETGLCLESSRYYTYMQRICPKTCEFCVSETSETKSIDCKDDKSYAKNCGQYQENGYCKEGSGYHATMKRICPKTCGFCGCKDSTSQASNCPNYKKKGFCSPGSSFYESMKKFCPNTCNLCHASQQKCANGPSDKGRVVGGEEATPNSWPWQVGLLYGSEFDCGGTLIAPSWVMTAGHCVVGRDVQKMKAVLGEHDWTKISGTEQTLNIAKIFKYPTYNLRDNVNDIALLKLASPAKLTKEVQFACLPDKNEESYDGQCFLTGWGYTSTSSFERSNTLQEVLLPVATREDCQKFNFKIGSGLKLATGQMCAGYGPDYSKIQTGCRGDSGGPLACRYGIRWTVDGVVSFGSSKCLGFEKYTVFTKVSYYRDWIDKTMKNN